MGFLLLPGVTVPATPTRLVEAPAVPPVASYQVAMTAYNAVPEQTDSTPFETASGAYSNPEIVAARSQDLGKELPFGTIIEVGGPRSKQDGCGYSVVGPIIGYRVIADTMNVRYTDRIDILFSNDARYELADGTVRNASRIFGVCKDVTIRVVGKIDPAHMGNLPKTQAELAALVRGGVGNALALK